jgi:hypothetical protein
MASVLGSYTLTSVSKTLIQSDNISYLSVICLSGTVTVLCSGKNVPSWNLSNSAISLGVGQGLNVQETVNIQSLDGVTIDATSGSAGVIVG